MKKQIILIIILLQGLCYAQKTKFAVKAGLSLSNTRFSVLNNGQELDRSFYEHDNYNNRTAFYVGGSVEFLLKPDNDKFLSIQVEVLYSKQGYTEDSYDWINTFELDQINIPVVLKYPILNKFSIIGGGYLGHVVTAQEYSSDSKDFKRQIEGYHNLDSGLIIGLEYKFKFGLFIESRYMYGLSDISKVNFPDFNTEWIYKNRVFQAGIGYNF